MDRERFTGAAPGCFFGRPARDRGESRKIHSMLVLTRKMSQTIKLGDDITITVVRTSNGSVKLGVEAPRNIRISREECGERVSSPPSESKVA